jgi:exonuclease III
VGDAGWRRFSRYHTHRQLLKENNIENGGELDALNSNPSLDLKCTLSTVPFIDYENDPIINMNTVSKFYDIKTFSSNFSTVKQPLILSLNVQSLNAKHDKLKDFILTLEKDNVIVDVIALQETWNIKFPNLVSLPGYQNVCFKNRHRGRGGGVGLFIRQGLDYQILNMPFNGFTDRIFESLTVQITDNSNSDQFKSYIVTSIYRSPTSINNVTHNDQINSFLNNLDQLFNHLNSINLLSIICLDSNINLLDVTNNQTAVTYMHNILNNGYVPVNCKATRTNNGNFTLIDQILVNNVALCSNSGSIIDDISDHLCN